MDGVADAGALVVDGRARVASRLVARHPPDDQSLIDDQDPGRGVLPNGHSLIATVRVPFHHSFTNFIAIGAVSLGELRLA